MSESRPADRYRIAFPHATGRMPVRRGRAGRLGRLMRAAPSLAVAALVSGSPSIAYAARQAAQDTTGSASAAARDLRAAFAIGYLVEDRNGDGVADFVPARIVIPSEPAEAEAAAAANVAARLGYETSAANLGLLTGPAATYDLPVVLIGRRAFDDLASPADAGELAPGQGSVSWIEPDARFRAGAVLIDGYDASGLLAATDYFAGRYPGVWAVDGPSIADAADRVDRFLRQRDIEPDRIAVQHAVLDAARLGMIRLVAAVEFADSADRAAARAALESQTASADSANADLAPRDLPVTDLHRLDLHLILSSTDTAGRGAAGGEPRRVAGARASAQRAMAPVPGAGSALADGHVVRILPARPWPTRAPNAFQFRDTPDFSLSELYTTGGLFRDTNEDLVPDRTDSYLSVHGGEAAAGLVDFAMRVGLEGAGVRLPLAEIGGQADRPSQTGFPIVFGRGHALTGRLAEEDRLHLKTAERGAGYAEYVAKAADEKPALVVSGSDSAGVSAIVGYLAGRAPYLWEYGKGNWRLSEVENEVRRFVQARGGAGQTAFAVQKLRTWLGRIDAEHGETIDSIHVELAAERRPEGLESFLEDVVGERYPSAKRTVEAHATGFGVGEPIFEQDFEVPWEVDDARALVDAAVAKLRPGTSGRIEVRVSESPQIRARLREEIVGKLRARGVDASSYDVVVLSAYKQGYSWLYDEVLPALREEDVARIAITYHTLKDSEEVRWQTVAAATRWLQELYPVDAVLARELGIADTLITFEPTRRAAPIYTVRALDAGGREVYASEFDAKYVVRPFFDLFPEYEQVRVTTGWVTVVSAGDTLVDERVITDPERFWDVFQTETYGRIVEYMMDVQDGRPSAGNAPYFDELRVELTLSEPNYRIGVDEEVISSMEALHEDIYFETLTLFDLIANRYGVSSLDYAGRVLPYIKPPVDGRPGRARITFTGKDTAVPELALTYRPRGREPVRMRYALSPLPTPAPKLRGISVTAGADEVRRLLFEVVAQDSVDRWDEYRARSSESSIDRTFLSVPLLESMVAAMAELHGRGLFGSEMAYDRVAEIGFRFTLEDDSATFERTAWLPRSREPRSTVRPAPIAEGWRWDGGRIVQWDTPIPPSENDDILGRLNTFPHVNVYWIGRSFLGQEIYAADFTPPHEAKYVSQAKLNALKPTLLLSGRQHANEVSSTSHILRLGELLATDSSYRAMLDRVNVVLHPITNPDGARLAYEMQLENPDFMLHAGYLGALGVDATSGGGSDPVYPESKVRPELAETWLPDISMNLHGYPSHEWVQYFAGYSAWVRSRSGGQRDWWSPRGWFVPGFSYVEDDRYPEIKRAQFAILDSVAAAITGEPDVDAMNRRLYARYRKYGAQDVEDFREYFHNGILVYQSLRGRTVSGQGPGSPRITYFSVTTEAPDETARGEWLQLVAKAGLAHTSALLRYLAKGQNRIERDAAEYEGFVTRMVYRQKPVLPAEEKAAAASTNGERGR